MSDQTDQVRVRWGRLVVIVGVFLGVIMFGNYMKNRGTPLVQPLSQSVPSEPQLSKAEQLQKIRGNCIAHYGRMCRDETEVFMASLRAGFNKGLRGE